MSATWKLLEILDKSFFFNIHNLHLFKLSKLVMLPITFGDSLFYKQSGNWAFLCCRQFTFSLPNYTSHKSWTVPYISKRVWQYRACYTEPLPLHSRNFVAKVYICRVLNYREHVFRSRIHARPINSWTTKFTDRHDGDIPPLISDQFPQYT